MQAHTHIVLSTADAGLRTLRKSLSARPLLAWMLIASVSCFHFAVCQAETLKVTTWNLGSHPSSQDGAETLPEAAATLKLLNPDVILLQEISNWKACLRLTELLKPLDYQVLVCSAFPGPSTNAEAEPQVAILAKNRAYFTWNRAWSSSHRQTAGKGGVVFAALEAGNQHIGFFNALLGADDAEPPAAVLLSQIQSVKAWETNQVQTFVLATSAGTQSRGTVRTLRKTAAALELAGFVDATEEMPLEARSAPHTNPGTKPEFRDVLFAGPAGFPYSPRLIPTPGFSHFPLTCDIELDAQKVALALDVRAENRRERDAKASATRQRLIGGAAAVLAVCLASGWIRHRRANKRAVAASVARQRRHVEELPKETAGTVRPIIFVNSPSKARPVPNTPPVARPKSVLRIQNLSRTSPERNAAPEAQPEPSAGESEPEDPPRALETSLPFAPLRLPAADPAVRQGVIQELAGWLKQKFVRKLLSDRQQMIQAHELATRMATTLDNRLARIEAQIQQQNQAYLKRIDDLNRELSAAREENRELIRERIAEVKAEMDAARAKVLAEADLNTSSLRL
jgi:hypothetical protein